MTTSNAEASDAGSPPGAPYAEVIAQRILDAHAELSARWLVQLNAILPVEPTEIFPSPNLLDHIPAVVREVGAYLLAPESEEIAANTTVIAKARELGLMRHQQRASVHQLLREYDILGRVLDEFVAAETERLGLQPAPLECIAVTGRLDRAVQILMQTTVDTFVADYTDTIAKQTERLQSFNRTVSHELRNPLATIQLVVATLQRAADTDARLERRWLNVIERSVNHMAHLLRDIENLTRAGDVSDSPSEQRVEIAAVGREVARQLEDMARAREVEITVDPRLPTLHVDAARLELILMNLVSNAIKYCDGEKPARWVRIERVNEEGGQCRIRVHDNGIGIPSESLSSIFDRFYRAHPELDEVLGNDGSGLGLAIVAECVEALKGTIAVDSVVGEGTRFMLTLPDVNGEAKA